MRRDHRQCSTPTPGPYRMSGGRLADVRGFTLIEILIALSTFLIILFAVYTTFESSRATYAAGEQKADIQQNARIAMELIGGVSGLPDTAFQRPGRAVGALRLPIRSPLPPRPLSPSGLISRMLRRPY